MTVCALVGLATLVSEARAQSAEDLINPPDDLLTTGSSETPLTAPPPVLPRLTITEDEQAVEPQRRSAKPKASPYDPSGIPAGGLRLFPAIEVGTVFSSNVRQSPTEQKAAVGLKVAPSLRLESDWTRHSWQTDIKGNYTAYAKQSDADIGSVDATSKLRLDIRRATTAELEATYNLTPTLPDDSGLAGGTEGRRLDQTFAANASVTQDFGGLSGRVKAGVERRLYGEEDLVGGGTRDNKDLNNWTPSVSLRLTYTDPPALKPFIEAGYSRRYHDNKTNSSGQNTNSGDIDLRLGASFDDGALWSGEAALTYLRRKYSDSSLDDLQTFGLNGNLTWRPTELTSIMATAETSLDDTTTDGRNYGLRVDLEHSLREDIRARVGSGAKLDKSDAGTDVTLTAGAGIEIQFSPEMAWTASYDATWFRAEDHNRNYTEHRVMTGIVLRR